MAGLKWGGNQFKYVEVLLAEVMEGEWKNLIVAFPKVQAFS